jgi:NADH dehydrogenase FAD-containing subunit
VDGPALAHADDTRETRTRTRTPRPKRTDLQSILILGSGPIGIEQAAEFDYCPVTN